MIPGCRVRSGGPVDRVVDDRGERHAGRLRLSACVDNHLLGMLIGSFYGRYVTLAGIPDDWPDRVLSAVWPPGSPAPPHDDHNP